MIKIKIIAVCAFLALVAAFYIGSIHVAYNKGYNQHALEVERQAVEVVVGSHSDILTAAKEVKDDEKNIKDDEDCGTVWTYDLRKCLLK